jgi:biotin carboxylase
MTPPFSIIQAQGDSSQFFASKVCRPSIVLPPSSIKADESSDKDPDTHSMPGRGILVVDGFSENHSGYIIERAIQDYNVGVVRVISPYMARGLQKQLEELKQSQEQQVQELDFFQQTAPLDPQDLKRWLDSLPFPLEAVICESDSGLDYAERLACAIDELITTNPQMHLPPLKHNGYLEARRDKYQMNERCRSRGIQTVWQALCRTPEEALKVAQGSAMSWQSNIADHGVIIKPRRGVASDRVALCRTLDEVSSAASQILDSIVFGTYDVRHDAVLMQEYVDGTEYAVDVISRDGAHKTAALWVYEKTSTNEDGASNPFAYLSGKLVSADDPNHPFAHAIMDYVEECLTALDIHWGMSHSEVKVSSKGLIRLMEVNVRQQNDHFGPICNICMGYNAFDLCLSAYLDDPNDDDTLFANVPSRPTLERQGVIINLACFVEGLVCKIHHLEEIQGLESYVTMELFPGFEVGSTVRRTKDIRSDCGWVHLVHESDDCMMRDYAIVRSRMPTMFQVQYD